MKVVLVGGGAPHTPFFSNSPFDYWSCSINLLSRSFFSLLIHIMFGCVFSIGCLIKGFASGRARLTPHHKRNSRSGVLDSGAPPVSWLVLRKINRAAYSTQVPLHAVFLVFSSDEKGV